MVAAVYGIAIVVLLGVLGFVLWVAGRAYLRFRGTRLVTCPESKEPAAVEVNARRAPLGAALTESGLQLKTCSRWPERQDCGQECLAQIESAPEACLIRNILAEWYEGKSCVFCHKPLGQINWLEHRPCLMDPRRVTFEWNDIRPEAVPSVLATHLPVCWNCHIAETFRREHPELVVDRSSRKQTRLEHGNSQ